MVKKYRYSEQFFSAQGEAKYTGVPTAWLRLWGCNFECTGFSQSDKPREEWKKEHDLIDLTNVTTMEELPVFTLNCDSAYSWSKRYRHLAYLETASEIVDKLTNEMKSEFNPDGLFKHARSLQETHMAFTGGEPMMSQHAIDAIIREFTSRDNCPAFVTIETNGTQKLKDATKELINLHSMTSEFGGFVPDNRGRTEWFWSVSPKLSASGEKWEDAIKPDILAEYSLLSNYGQLKYVVDGSKQCWEEVEEATNMYRKAGVNFPVWIMPVGATEEQQRNIAGDIATETIRRGYNISTRLHCTLWGNKIGT